MTRGIFSLTTIAAACGFFVCCAEPIAAQRPVSVSRQVTADPPAKEPSLAEKLNKRIDFDLVEQPLKDVFEYLRQETGIQFVLQLKKLEEASISPDTPITKSLKRVRVKTLLELLLADLELTYVEKDGLLLITTPEDAESRLVTRVYDCRDLLAMSPPEVKAPPGAAPQGGAAAAPAAEAQGADHPLLRGRMHSIGTEPSRGGLGGAGMPQQPRTEFEKRTDQLIELITSTVKPDSWDDVGGPGAIDAYNGLFVISQTDNVHEQVEHVLDMLRHAAGLDAAAGAKVVR